MAGNSMSGWWWRMVLSHSSRLLPQRTPRPNRTPLQPSAPPPPRHLHNPWGMAFLAGARHARPARNALARLDIRWRVTTPHGAATSRDRPDDQLLELLVGGERHPPRLRRHQCNRRQRREERPHRFLDIEPGERLAEA